MKIKNYISAALILFFGITLFNCTIQKRKYTNGFYIDVKHKVDKRASVAEVKKPIDVLDIAIAKKEDIKTKETLISSINKTPNIDLKNNTYKVHKIANDSCGDLIKLLDGTLVEAKVIEINQTHVKYKKCNNFSGPVYTIALEKVERIQYKNGSQDIVDSGTIPRVRFVPPGSELKYKVVGSSKSPSPKSVSKPKDVNTPIYPKQPKETSQSNSEDNFNQTAIGSLICGIATFFIPIAIITGPIALITGIVALRQINNGVGNRGRGMATFGIVIGTIVLFVILILILSFLV